MSQIIDETFLFSFHYINPVSHASPVVCLWPLYNSRYSPGVMRGSICEMPMESEMNPDRCIEML